MGARVSGSSSLTETEDVLSEGEGRRARMNSTGLAPAAGCEGRPDCCQLNIRGHGSWVGLTAIFSRNSFCRLCAAILASRRLAGSAGKLPIGPPRSSSGMTL